METCPLYIYSVHISVKCMESSKTQDMIAKMDLLAQLAEISTQNWVLKIVTIMIVIRVVNSLLFVGT